MSLDDVQPNAFQRFGHQNPIPSPHTGVDFTSQAALNILADTSVHTAGRDVFTQHTVHPLDESDKSWFSAVYDLAAKKTVGAFNFLANKTSDAANFVAKKAIEEVDKRVFPVAGVYSDKIAQYQSDLLRLTGANIASETAKVIAKNQIHTFTYLLSNLDKLTAADAAGSIKKFVTVKDEKLILNYAGTGFLYILSKHTGLLEETFEVNILNAMTRGVSLLHATKEKDPFFLVTLANDIMGNIIEEISAPDSYDEKSANLFEHDEFITSIQHSLIETLFPGGATEIEIPVSLQGWLEKTAFIQIQEKAIPRQITKLYDKATSDITKYKLLATAVQKLKKMLSTDSTKSSTKTKEAESREPYPQQEQFNKNLVGVTKEFIKHVKSPLLTKIEKKILKKVENEGPKIVHKLATIDLNAQLNNALKKICTKLSPAGNWEDKEVGHEAFNFVAQDPKTALEKQEKERVSLAKHQETIAKTIDTISEDLDGLIAKLAVKKSKKPHKNSRLNKIKSGVAIVFTQIRKGLITFAFKVFRVEKRVNELSKQVLTFAESINLKSAAKPIKKAVLRKK
ncbi:MAG: hypothetical protein LLF94_02180 [Chlamydiales bacterium]|nr:hypothetical protein [Chlamydiales bacterium]